MLNLFTKLREKFINDNNPEREDDEKALDEQEKKANELLMVKELLATPEGKVLKNWLIDEIETIIKGLIFSTKQEDDKRDKLISDLKSYVDLFNKLRVDSELDAIRQYLESLLKD